jgi:hypothetical protein
MLQQLVPLGDRDMRPAINMYTGRPVRRPNPHVKERYELDFTCDGEWLYVNAFARPRGAEMEAQKHLVNDCGERWRIVDAWTGEIVEQSPTVSFTSRFVSFFEDVVARYRRMSHWHT